MFETGKFLIVPSISMFLLNVVINDCVTFIKKCICLGYLNLIQSYAKNLFCYIMALKKV
jgi:hypothetical protein